ncbi:MAG: dTMP kinase [Clostridia bacterium]|nr:dTMP kinase [Clostridia bacterium]
MERGKFIVFEGTDGSGKSTQIKLLGKYLSSKGVEVYLTREPTDSPFGALLRSCLTGRVDADERAIAALFAADRLDHILNEVNGIRAMLEAGVTVLCDRYYFSSFAYNGGFVPLEWIIELNRQAMELMRPDLVIYIDLPPEEGMRRVAKRGEAERYETLERQKLIREKYFEVFERFKDQENIVIVKSEENKAETQEAIRRAANAIMFGGKQ